MKNNLSISFTCGLTYKSIFFIRELIKNKINIKDIFIQTNSFRLKRELKKIKLKKPINAIRFLDRYIFLYLLNFQQTPAEFLISRIKWYFKKKKILNKDLLNLDYHEFDGDIFFRLKIIKKILEISKLNSKVFTVKNINLEKKENPLLKEKIEVLVIMGGGIIKKKIFSRAKHGAIVLHNTFLPKLRGWGGGEIWSLIKNDKTSLGFSAIFADEKFDSGDIVCQKNLIIDKNDNFEMLIEKNLILGVELLKDALQKIMSKDFVPIKQNNNLATYINRYPSKKEIIIGLENLEKIKLSENFNS